jgi:hypothetical protein
MECMSTMLMKLELPERQGPLPGTPNVEVVLRQFLRHCYKSSPVVVLYWRGIKSLWLAMDEHGEHQDLRGLGHRSVTPYVHRRMRVVLLKR